MSSFGRNFLISAAMLSVPLSVEAATFLKVNSIGAGENVSVAAVLRPDDNIEFRFKVLEDLVIPSFSVSGTGSAAGLDLGAIRYGFTDPGTNGFTTIEVSGTSTFAGGFLDGMTLSAGDRFSVFFNDGIQKKVAITLSFLTQVPSQKPLPAPGILLVAALAAIGAVGKRKQKRAATPLAV